jgi:hypothetical protein
VIIKLLSAIQGLCDDDDQDDLFFISNFRRVLNVVCLLLGDSPASVV